MTSTRKTYPDRRGLKPEQRRQIINLWSINIKTGQIAKEVQTSPLRVNEVLNAYIRKLKRMERQNQVRNDIEPTDYSQHDEYSRHFAGAEYEDNRPPHERGKDWPIKGYL